MSVVPQGPGPGDFFTSINNSQAGQLISLAANSLQILSTFGSLFSIPSLSDSTEIEDQIEALAAELAQDFAALGTLVVQQIGFVLENENVIAMGDAMAHSSTALDLLTHFAQTRDTASLDSADTESDLGIQFFLNLPATAPDFEMASRTQPFFLPGVVKAGTVRVMLLAARDRDPAAMPLDVEEIKAIIALSNGMIASVISFVNGKHTVQPRVHVMGGSGPDAPSVDQFQGFSHDESGQVLQFFAGPGTSLGSPATAKALRAAEAARTQGVTDELAFLGLPAFQRLVAKWQSEITAPAPLPPRPIITRGPREHVGAASPAAPQPV